MLKKILAGAILTALLLACAGQAQAAEIITRLSNGLLVYIIQDKRFPLVCTRLYVRAGSATESPEQAGISHVLEHMVFKGTSHRPKGQVARDVEALGGYINAATSFDKTWYLTDMPAAHWREGMDVVKDMAFQASLDTSELEAEKNVVISELERGEDSPMRKLFEAMQVATLKNTAYGRPIIGFVDSIRALTVENLRDYVKRWYQPQNMMLIVAGDIEPDSVLAHAQKLFGDLKNNGDLAALEPFDLATASMGSPQVEIIRGPWSKVYLGLSLPAPCLRDLRSIELDALAYLLAGDGTGIFYRKYRYDSQLADSISVDNMSFARAGMFSLSATLDPDKTETFWDSITADLAGLDAKNFSAEAIQRAIFNMQDSMDRAGETLNGLTAWKGAIQFDLGGEVGENNIRFTQKNIDQTQLRNAIASWLKPERARLRVLAPNDAKLPDFAAIMAKNWMTKEAEQSDAKTAAANTAQEVIDIGNDCKLILIPDNGAPYISLELLLPGGNAMLKPDEQGLADLSARLLTDGCGELNNAALERWLAERAASISARAGLQTFGLSLSGPARFNADFFGLFKTMLFRPRFDAADLTREVNNMKAAIRRRDDQPLSYIFAKLNPFLFPGGQPYGYDSLGNRASLETLNTLKVRDFWARQGGQPWALAIAGAFDREEAVSFAKKLAQPHAAIFTAKMPKWGNDGRELDLRLPGRNQAHLMRIYPTEGASGPDAPALELLEAAISGQSGVLFTKLRDEQGLGYTVTAFNRSMPLAGYMAFYIGTSPDKMEDAGKGFDEIIADLKANNLPEETLRTAANRLLGDYERGRQSLSARAREAATNTVLGRPLSFQKDIIAAARKLTPENIREIAKKYLNNPYQVTLLP